MRRSRLVGKRVIRIVESNFKLIDEERRSFIEGNAMSLLVKKILSLVPFNGEFSRMTLQASASIFILKMVTHTPISLTLLTCDYPQNMRQHLSPPGPIVIHIRPPQIQRVRDVFCLENA